jgi:hypothetical protein
VTRDRTRPTRRIFLGGDEVSWTEDRISYGMTATIISGHEKGKAVAEFLGDE